MFVRPLRFDGSSRSTGAEGFGTGLGWCADRAEWCVETTTKKDGSSHPRHPALGAACYPGIHFFFCSRGVGARLSGGRPNFLGG